MLPPHCHLQKAQHRPLSVQGDFMVEKTGVLQVCVTCKRVPLPGQEVPDGPPDGQALFEALQDACAKRPDLDGQIAITPVECMNGCQLACTVAIRADNKYNFVIGKLDSSAEKIDDLLNFAQSFVDSENGLPPWRDRPVHIRKNTLVRLHPVSSQSIIQD
ncbi:hypothetical protein C0081_03275 [Cohaesibacter celericrescens]|uniref:Metal-binding protein n=2 Tax=Cohaesibacter celericrescens TaxID=2067669 RepID=A0A2N5XVT7_9HYPH|nr:hypothetical protein C0081_03275 [Cohaesibacter celericrescens]